MCEGIEKELEGIDLGDKRLNRRSGSILEALAANARGGVTHWLLTDFSRITRLRRIKSYSLMWRQRYAESTSILLF